MPRIPSWIPLQVPLLVLVGLIGVTAAAEVRADGLRGDRQPVCVTSRHPEDPFESPRSSSIVELGDAPMGTTESVPGTAADALSGRRQLPGVLVLARTPAGGSPVLRGLGGNRVLLLVDGVRLNNAITRHGDGDLLATVDPLQISRAEVLHGPGSVLFGSDAMGGVINLDSRRPVFDPARAWDLSADAAARWHSATHGLVGRTAAEGHLRRVGIRVAGSIRRHDDLYGGRDAGQQPFTSFTGGAADVTASWKLGDAAELELSYSTAGAIDVPQSAASTPRDFSLFAEQWRDLVALRYRDRFDHFFLQRIETTWSYQLHRRRRQSFRLDADRVERETERVGVIGGSLLAQTALPRNRISYGADFYHDRIGSSAEQELISARTVSQSDRGRYHDGSLYTSFGAFVHDQLSLGKLAFDIGGRISSWKADIPVTAGRPVERADWTALGSLHGRFLVGDGLNLIAGLSQGYRAPNIDDCSARGCGIDRYDVPGDDLDPERSLTFEAGVKLDLFGLLRGSLLYYHTHLDDLLVARPATLDTGSGPVSTFTCGTNVDGSPRVVPIVKRENASGGVHGIEGQLELDLDRRWSLFAWVAWARGELTFDQGRGSFDEPLDRVPPLNGLAGVRYTGADEQWYAQLGLRWATRQDRLGAADRNDPAICPASGSSTGGLCRGTPAFAALDIHGAARLHRMLRLTLALQNLTNESYRLHGAALDAPGVSASLGLELLVR